jgi:kinesin family protein C1
MTDAAANARGAMLPPPPPTGSIKHKPSGRELATFSERQRPLTSTVPESDAKFRKTLAERGGETFGSKIAAPTTVRPVNAAVKSALASGMRPYSGSASLSRVPSQKTSKHATANSFGNSVGHGPRAISANSYGTRPKSAYGGHNRSKSHHQAARPATSFAQHEEAGESERKGAQAFLISTNPQDRETLRVSKNVSRGPNNVSSHHVSRNRPISLHVPQKRTSPMSAPRAISSPSPLFPTSPTPEEPTDADDILDGFGALTLSAPVLQDRARRIGRGTTSGKTSDISFKSTASSSLLPRPTPKRQMAPPPPPVPSTPTRAVTSLLCTPFLNRFTNDRCPAFDDSRVASLEAQFETFKEQIKDDLSQQNSLKDTIKLYESRSTCWNLLLST